MANEITTESGQQVEAPEQRQYEPTEPGEEDAVGPYRDYEEMSPKHTGPHFDLVDIYFYVALSLVSDIIGVSWIARFLTGPLLFMWLYFKGVKSVNKNAIAKAVELIPFLNVIPIDTVSAILTIWSTNSPESFDKAFGVFGKLAKAKKAKPK